MLLGRSTLFSLTRIQSAYEEHLAIVAAIELRDAVRAEQAARAHISNAARERLRQLRTE